MNGFEGITDQSNEAQIERDRQRLGILEAEYKEGGEVDQSLAGDIEKLKRTGGGYGSFPKEAGMKIDTKFLSTDFKKVLGIVEENTKGPINIEAIKTKDSDIKIPHDILYGEKGLEGGIPVDPYFGLSPLDILPSGVGTKLMAIGGTLSTAIPKKMSTSILSKIRDVDRNISPKSIEELQDITSSIKKEGIKKPVTITISTKDNMAYITDGNTRVTVAKNLGIEEVPVRFEKTNVPFTKGQKEKAKPLSEIGIDLKMIPDKTFTKEEEIARKELLNLLKE